MKPRDRPQVARVGSGERGLIVFRIPLVLVLLALVACRPVLQQQATLEQLQIGTKKPQTSKRNALWTEAESGEPPSAEIPNLTVLVERVTPAVVNLSDTQIYGEERGIGLHRQ